MTDIVKEPEKQPVFSRSLLAIFRDWLLLAVVGAVIGLDQLTKYLVDANMRLGQSIPAEGFFRLTYTTNSGTIFGLFPGQTLPLTILSVGAIAFLIYFYRTHPSPTLLMRAAIGVLLGGALGNLIDRLRHGAVIDFVDVGPWPIFNIADSAITIGIALIVIIAILTPETKKPGQNDADGPPRASGDGRG
ncbi:MAG: signal peptidase II [SAR202 cluster bacterium]|nr:signal peptidase II [SAR202 cluster bacterium]